MIPLSECVHRGIYAVGARNFQMGVYHAPAQGFLGIRKKFGQVFIDCEYHWDTGPPHGTAKCYALIGMLPDYVMPQDNVVYHQQAEYLEYVMTILKLMCSMYEKLFVITSWKGDRQLSKGFHLNEGAVNRTIDIFKKMGVTRYRVETFLGGWFGLEIPIPDPDETKEVNL